MLLITNFENDIGVQPDRTTSYIVQSMYAFAQSISVPDFIGLTPRTLFLLPSMFSSSNNP